MVCGIECNQVLLVYPLNDAKRACNALDRDFVFLPKEKNISIKQSGTISLKRVKQILASFKECSVFFQMAMIIIGRLLKF